MGSSRHVSVVSAASAESLYAYTADPAHLPAWAAGLAQSSITQADGHWLADSPMGRVRVDFTARNDLGVLDHTVTLASGEKVPNPMRMIPHEKGCKVVFTVRRRPGMSEEQLEQDCRAVLADLQALQSLLGR